MIISEFKQKFFTNFCLFINIILYIFFCIYFVNIQASQLISQDENILSYQRAKEMSLEIAKLKLIFPKLLNNEVLLDKVLEKILEEFDKDIYRELFLDRKDKAYKIELLHKYNILSEFPNVVRQITSEPKEYILGFVANLPDRKNYETYLRYKQNGFKGSQGKFWKDYWHGPSNFNLISKNNIDFLVNTFEWILLSKEKLKNNYDESLAQNVDYQQQILDGYNYLEKLSIRKNNSYQDLIASKNRDINVLVEKLYQLIKETTETKNKLNDVSKKLQQTTNQLKHTQTLTAQQKQELEATKQQAQKDKDQLLNELKSRDALISMFKEELIIATNNISTLKDQITADQQIAAADKQQYNEHIEELNRKINELNNQIFVLTNDNQRLMRENTSYREQLNTSQQTINHLTQRLDNTLKETTETKNKLNDVSKKLQQTTNQLKHTQTLTAQQKQELEAT
ncbi:MAG: hypothetical protein Q8784_02220, partial [Vigna little leaf phytoplasma]|nr:hypothetical protein [Vigna little leaf phytoplasma]